MKVNCNYKECCFNKDDSCALDEINIDVIRGCEERLMLTLAQDKALRLKYKGMVVNENFDRVIRYTEENKSAPKLTPELMETCKNEREKGNVIKPSVVTMKKMFIDKGMTVRAMAIQLGVPQSTLYS